MKTRILGLLAAVGAVDATWTSATGPHGGERIPDQAELLAMLQSSTPPWADPTFDCAWRVLAYSYAKQLQPFRTVRDFSAIFDALELAACNATFSATDLPHAPSPTTPVSDLITAAATTLYVDAVNGKDSNPGTQQQPFQHLEYAVGVSRTVARPVALILRQGVYRIVATITLTAADSQLSVAAYPGEEAVVSGGTSLAGLAWTVYNVTGPQWTVQQNENAVYNDGCSHHNGTYPDWATCQAMCKANNTAGGGCNIWTWHNGSNPQPWPGVCCFMLNGRYDPVGQSDHISGFLSPGVNVYSADVTPYHLPPTYGNVQFTPSLLYSTDGGARVQRATRARYPNSNPELDVFPVGWITSGGQYITTPYDMNTNVVHVPLPDNYPGMFQDYYVGFGGPCERMVDNQSYWCQPNGRVAGKDYFVNTPAGIVYDATVLPNAPYTHDTSGAVFNYWRHGHWFTQMTSVSSYTASNSTLMFGWGAFQGAEGDSTGESWYIENVFEELDYPNEFYYDASAGRLYFNYNGTGAIPSNWTFEMPFLQTLISFQGTQVAPVRNVTLSGLKFTSAAPTYMAPHGTPSAGDWGLARVGAILLNGTEGITIANCHFERLDGNGVSINGYNRNATVDTCHFEWIGDSAIASWGYTDMVDASAGNFPVGNVIKNVLCHELGFFEKQSSCYFQAISARTRITNAIFYNGPRAFINFNDDGGGDNLIATSLLWNSCRESSDHGPFNSWGRLPYITTIYNGTATFMKAPDNIISNFMVANYGANGGAIDNDDGSSFYNMVNNFFVYGGHKSDFDGHSKISIGNIHAFANVYGPRCLSIGLPLPGFNEGFINNTCILADAGDTYLDLGGCSTDPSKMTLTTSNNRIYAPQANVTVNCGSTITFEQWMSYGFDKGTTVADMPTATEIVGWAAALLNIPTQ